MYNYNQYQNCYNQYAYVNGIEGAKSFQIQPGKTVLLVDSDNSFIYFKSANELGQSTLRYFSISEIDEAKAKEMISNSNPKFVLKADFDELNKKYDSINTKLSKLLKSLNKEE